MLGMNSKLSKKSMVLSLDMSNHQLQLHLWIENLVNSKTKTTFF